MTRVHLRECVIAGVLYAEDFDHIATEPAAVRSGSASIDTDSRLMTPSFNLDELQAATRQAFEDGRNIERRERQDSLDRQLASCLSSLKTQIAESESGSAQMIESGLFEIARMSLAMVATALPTLCAMHAEDELKFVLQQMLPAVRRMPELRIRVHPNLRESVEREIRLALDETTTRTVWSESDTLRPGDITVAWQNGTALRDTEATCSAIRDAVVALFQDGASDKDKLTGHDDGE